MKIGKLIVKVVEMDKEKQRHAQAFDQERSKYEEQLSMYKQQNQEIIKHTVYTRARGSTSLVPRSWSRESYRLGGVSDGTHCAHLVARLQVGIKTRFSHSLTLLRAYQLRLKV